MEGYIIQKVVGTPRHIEQNYASMVFEWWEVEVCYLDDDGAIATITLAFDTQEEASQVIKGSRLIVKP